MRAKIQLTIAVLAGLFMLAMPSGLAGGPFRFVHRDGTRIMDGNGKPLFLRAMNLGGWLHWEGWIFGGPVLLQESKTLRRLEELVGTDETERFYQTIHENFVTEDDIDAISKMGFNCVRVSINHRLLEDDANPYHYKEEGWKILDTLVQRCAARNIYVVFDMHSAPGGQLLIMDGELGKMIWHNRENMSRTLSLWKAIAQRYANSETIAGYDLLNEPSPPSSVTLASTYKQIIGAIREVDSNHMLIVEGSKFASNFDDLKRPLTDNEALSFHMYNWFGDTRLKQLAGYERLVELSGLPLWNGESGENKPNMVATTIQMFDEPKYKLSGWAYWTWKKVPNSFSALLGIAPPPEWKHLITWIAGRPVRKPSKEEALRAMGQFCEAVKFRNCIIDQSLARAVQVR